MTSELPAWMVSSLLGVWAVSAGLIVIGMVVAVRRLPISGPSKRRRLWLSVAIFVGWCVLVFSLAKGGAFELDRHSGVRVPLPLVVVGTIVLAYAALRIQAWREVVLTVPDYWLVAIQTFRIAGGVLLVGTLQGLLPGAFGIPAALGDCLIGVTAVLVAMYTYQRRLRWTTMVRAWNYLGILDLVMAGALGFLTSPLQLSRFPLVVIPALRVPLAYTLHLYSLRVLRQSRQLVVPPQAPCSTVSGMAQDAERAP